MLPITAPRARRAPDRRGRCRRGRGLGRASSRGNAPSSPPMSTTHAIDAAPLGRRPAVRRTRRRMGGDGRGHDAAHHDAAGRPLRRHHGVPGQPTASWSGSSWRAIWRSGSASASSRAPSSSASTDSQSHGPRSRNTRGSSAPACSPSQPCISSARLKYRCLHQCRSPRMFLIQRWHGDRERSASLGIGVAHGVFCVGCCWTLMLVMFTIETFSLGLMLAIGAVMAAEKNFPWGRKLRNAAHDHARLRCHHDPRYRHLVSPVRGRRVAWVACLEIPAGRSRRSTQDGRALCPRMKPERC